MGLWNKAITIEQEAIGVATGPEKRTLAPALTYYRTAKALAAQHAQE